MTNLKNLGKNLSSKNILYLVLIVVLLTFSIKIAKKRELKLEKKYNESIQVYSEKMDSLRLENLLLNRQEIELNKKIDSLKVVQNNINNLQKNETKIIRSASADDHAKWFWTKVNDIQQ